MSTWITAGSKDQQHQLETQQSLHMKKGNTQKDIQIRNSLQKLNNAFLIRRTTGLLNKN